MSIERIRERAVWCAYHNQDRERFADHPEGCTPTWCQRLASKKEIGNAVLAIWALAEDLTETLAEKADETHCGTIAGSVLAIRELARHVSKNLLSEPRAFGNR